MLVPDVKSGVHVPLVSGEPVIKLVKSRGGEEKHTANVSLMPALGVVAVPDTTIEMDPVIVTHPLSAITVTV